MKQILSAALIGTALLLATPASAKTWTIDYANSRLGFAGFQGENKFEGSFKAFEATVDFDPAKPEAGKITANIDITSITTGDAERDSNLPLPAWFDTKKFPQAQFASTGIKATGTDKTGTECFEAAGTLTIKGISKPVKLPFCLKQEADHWRAAGKVPLMRNDFEVGQGQWAQENFVKYAVEVSIDLAAKPQ